jgi:2-methylcitrate dehydratase PrpD
MPNTEPQSLTSRVAEAVARTSYESLTEQDRKAVKRSIIDTVGIMIPALNADKTCGRLARQVPADCGDSGPCSVLGAGARMSLLGAAFLNGCFVQALDYGDTVDATGHHPSGQSLPAALALGQARRRSGRDLIAAVVLGQDIGARLSAARTDKARVRSPWFPPTVIGPFSAAVAAGRVIGLDARQVTNALGLALHRSHGQVRAVTAAESDVRAVRYGLVAVDGVMAATMAESGVGAVHDAIRLLYETYFDGELDARAILDGLGEEFRGTRASVKPWPSCRASHGHVGALRHLVEQYGITPDSVEAIVLEACEFSVRELGEPAAEKRRPRSGIQSKSSLQYVAAVAVAGTPRIGDFLDSELKDPARLALADRVVVTQSDDCGLILPATAEIRLKDGRVVRHRATDIAGTPTSPMSDDELEAKFRDCAATAARPPAPHAVSRLLDVLWNLERIEDLSELAQLLP